MGKIRRRSVTAYEKVFGSDFYGTADGMIAEFQHLKTVYGEDAVFSLSDEGGWDDCEYGIYVRYVRLETDVELAVRQSIHDSMKKRKVAKKDRERAEYERLKKKFDGA